MAVAQVESIPALKYSGLYPTVSSAFLIKFWILFGNISVGKLCFWVDGLSLVTLGVSW